MKLYEIRQIEQKDPSTYVDLRDYEMEVLKDTLGQLNYSVIHAIGGYTCLDLLYATQDKNISIKNYEISMDVDHVLARQKMYTGWFNKENVVENKFIQIDSMDQVPYNNNDILTNCSGDIELFEGTFYKKDTPQLIVHYHYGHMKQIENIIKINKKVPLRGLTNKLAIFSEQDLKYRSTDTYRFNIDKLLFIENVKFFHA